MESNISQITSTSSDKTTIVLPSQAAPPTPFARTDSPWSTAVLDATKLPPASKQREIIKLANNKLSNGYALFTHYIHATLELRREALLSSGATKKKFYKTVGKLYEDLPDSQKVFWNGEAARLRVLIKEKAITHEECVRNVGTPDQWATYIHFAETAVAEYLQLPPPGEAEYHLLPMPLASLPASADYLTFDDVDNKMAYTAMDMSNGTEMEASTTETEFCAPETEQEMDHAATSFGQQPLLDTLPDRFTVEPRMMYGHFARYKLDEILTTATRKRQLEKLHQLADLFDQTGKVLFYYYAYPRLWKRLRPLNVDESIATFAQDIWHYAEGNIAEEWKEAELHVKKLLGDGSLDGLALLRLDGLDPEDLRLHAMAEKAVSVKLKGLERSM